MIALVMALSVAVQLPDSARQARYERVLGEVSSALDAVRGAAAGFRTDLSRASSELVLERATRIHNSCRDADAAAARQQALLAEGVYTPSAQPEQTRLARETARLRQALTRCQREWTVPDRPRIADADSLRAWGPYRTAQLDGALRRFIASLRGFMKRAELKKPAVS
jgi:hypothetical protein